MLIVVADVVVNPESRARAEEVGKAMIIPSRAEDGCHGYAYSWDVVEPDRLRIIELWADEAALRFHFKTPHMAAFRQALGGLATGALSIVVYEGGSPHDIGRYAE